MTLPRVPPEYRYAIGVLALGFVAVGLFWLLGDYGSLTGLPAYDSATWGDGLFLPLQALAVKHLTDQMPALPSRWPARVGGVAGGVTGAAVIVVWLADPAPHLNWTMPRPHEFDPAGWWHALFLVGACSLFARLWVDLLTRLRAQRRRNADTRGVTQSAWFACAVAAAFGYAALLWRDSVAASGTSAGLASAGALVSAVLAFMVVLLLALTSRVAEVGPAMYAALGLAGGAVAVILAPPDDALSRTALFAAFFTGVALASTAEPRVLTAPLRRRPHGPPALELLAVPAVCCLVPLIGARAPGSVTVASSGVLILGVIAYAVVLRFLRRGREGVDGALWVSVGIAACLLAAGLSASWLSHRPGANYVTGGFVLTLVGAVLGGVFLPYYRADYERVMHLEAGRNEGDKPTAPESAETSRIWARVGGYGSAAFASLLALTLAVAPSLGWTDTSSTAPLLPLWGVLGLAGLVLAATWPSIRNAGRPLTARRTDRSLAGTVAPAVAGILLFGWVVVQTVAGSATGALPLIQAVVIAAFCLECMLGNGLRLHLAQVTTARASTALAVTLGICGVAYWSLTSGVSSEGHPLGVGASLVAWSACASCVAVLTTGTTCALFGSSRSSQLTQYGALAGALQDTFLVCILWLVAGWLPLVTVSHVPPGASERWSAIGTIVAGFLLLFGPAFMWVLENNDTHNGRERRKYGADVPPYAQEDVSTTVRLRALPSRIARLGRRPPGHQPRELAALDALDAHTAVQNLLALTLVATTIIGAIGTASAFSPGTKPRPGAA